MVGVEESCREEAEPYRSTEGRLSSNTVTVDGDSEFHLRSPKFFQAVLSPEVALGYLTTPIMHVRCLPNVICFVRSPLVCVDPLFVSSSRTSYVKLLSPRLLLISNGHFRSLNVVDVDTPSFTTRDA